MPPPSRSISDQSISTKSAASSTAPLSRTQSSSPNRNRSSAASPDAVNSSSPLSANSQPQSHLASFAQYLDISDPSRKRTISSATAQASDADRATKAQKRSPPIDLSSDAPTRTFSSQLSSPSKLLEKSQVPPPLAPSAMDEYGTNTMSGYTAWPDPPLASDPNNFMVGIESSNGIHSNIFSADTSSAQQLSGYASAGPSQFTFAAPPPPVPRSTRASRASSYTGANPFASSSAVPLKTKEEPKMEDTMSLFMGGAYSRAPSPDSSTSDSDGEADGDLGDLSRSSSRRSSRGIHAEPRFARRVASTVDQALDLETKERVDKIFMTYLQRICSNCEWL